MEDASLRAELNPEQYEAVTTTDGPLLILAGAGSGKTRVLVHRVAHLLEKGLARPHEIFAVTFTNKAAGEMRSRIERLVGPAIRGAWIGTFHSLSARMLRMEGHRLGFTPSFTIYDTDDQKTLIKSTMKELHIDPSSRGTPVGSVAHLIDQAKNRGQTAKRFVAECAADDPIAAVTKRVYPRYQSNLARSDAMDFGDLLLLALELLRHHPEAHERFAGRFRYVMVDEFQDTNVVQYDLLKVLVRPHENLAVVGDDDQSIYRWRGADVGNILSFTRDYPTANVVKLEQNYRSTGRILEAANAVIRQNTLRHTKRLWTQADSGKPIGVALVERSEDEAMLVANIIARRTQAGESPERFAVLYRTNAQSRLLEDAFRRRSIPFTLIGSTGFYERTEVKDILAYLRLTANPSSRQDFERIINTPSRGIGDKTLHKLREAAEPHGFEGANMLDLSKERLFEVGLSAGAVKKLKELSGLLTSFRSLAKTASATEVATQIIKQTDYLAYLEHHDSATAEDRIENVAELVSSIAELEASAPREALLDEDGPSLAGARTPLEEYLDRAALVTSVDRVASDETVSLMTLHAAKGLEFPTVFITGLDEMTFPGRRAMEGTTEDMEEERRLFYVGITRAMEELNLLTARYRRMYGSEELRWPSRFLGELPDHVVGKIEGASASALRPEISGVPRTLRGSSHPMERSLSRGGDRIEYDSEGLEETGIRGDLDDRRVGRGSGSLGSSAPFRPGVRVFHNSFGYGTVEAVDEYLTIRFAKEGLKRVAPRFVRSAEESC